MSLFEQLAEQKRQDGHIDIKKLTFGDWFQIWGVEQKTDRMIAEALFDGNAIRVRYFRNKTGCNYPILIAEQLINNKCPNADEKTKEEIRVFVKIASKDRYKKYA